MSSDPALPQLPVWELFVAPGTPLRGPVVSVLVPAYNHAAYVSEALESVLREGFRDLELLVLDDGSMDGTWERVREWVAHRRPPFPVHVGRQANAGLSTTLNRLLSKAIGDYVVPVASDDRLVPGGIESRIRALELRPDLAAVFGDCQVIDPSGAVITEHGTGFGENRARERMLRDPCREIVERWAVPGPVLLYRRDAVISDGGYDERLMVEDWDLYLRLAARNAIAYVDLVVAEYRWHGQNSAARSDRAIDIADQLRDVAWRNRKLFRGHLYLELVHESATWAARAASLRRQRLRWLTWKAASIVMKLVAMAVPRRPSDQKLAGSVSRKEPDQPGRATP